MKDMGESNYYIGMKITKTDDFIKLNQAGYVREIILEKYKHLLREESRHTDETES